MGTVARTRRQVLSFLAVLAAVLAVIGGAVAAGAQSGSHNTSVLTGRAHIGEHMGSIRVDGWWYGIPSDVAWVDAQGTQHEGGWPACLGGPGHSQQVTFGAVPVDGPDGSSWRQVVWIDCRS